MKVFLLCLIQLLVVGFYARSQCFLGETKDQVSKHMHLDKKIKFEIVTTDSTIAFSPNDPNYTKTSKVFHFNKNGRCDSEASFFECEECYQYELKKYTSRSIWLKTDSIRYTTKYGKHFELVTHYQAKPFAFVIREIDEATWCNRVWEYGLSKKGPVFTAVEYPPSFTKHLDNGWQTYVAANLKYPANAKQSGSKGQITLTAIVERDGKLTDVRIKNGLCEECDAEALRLIKASPNWRPGITGSKPVRCLNTIIVDYNP